MFLYTIDCRFGYCHNNYRVQVCILSGYLCKLSQGETDEQYLSKVADVMHSLFATHGATLLPLFDQLLPTFASMLVSL